MSKYWLMPEPDPGVTIAAVMPNELPKLCTARLHAMTACYVATGSMIGERSRRSRSSTQEQQSISCLLSSKRTLQRRD